MKKILLAFCFILGLNAVALAQDGKRIEAIKVAFITRELNLSADEAQKFWPVYNKYFDELKVARDQNKDDEIAFGEKSLAIRKKYKPDFKKILNDDARVNKVFKVDSDFLDLLKNRLQERKKNMQKNKKVNDM